MSFIEPPEFDDWEIHERETELEDVQLEEVERPGFDTIGLILEPYKEQILRSFYEGNSYNGI